MPPIIFPRFRLFCRLRSSLGPISRFDVVMESKRHPFMEDLYGLSHVKDFFFFFLFFFYIAKSVANFSFGPLIILLVNCKIYARV